MPVVALLLLAACGAASAAPEQDATSSTAHDHSLSDQYDQTPAVCLDGVGPAALDEAFGNGHLDALGDLSGFDEPTTYVLPDGRKLWLVHDAFLDLRGVDKPYFDQSYLQNLAILIDDRGGTETCVSTVFRRDGSGEPLGFEIGPEDPAHRHETSRRWYWALGGGIDADGNLAVFWQEVIEDRSHDDVRGPHDGINRHSVGVWLSTYDPASLERLTFEPAPDPDATPMYGAAVADDVASGWTYLFGNTLNRDLTLEGGFDNGPHSSTINTVARVPLGRFGEAPEYWNGSGWSTQRSDAASIHTAGWAEWMMQPRLIDGQWTSVTKGDAWWGDELVVQTAEDPWGPWTTVYREPVYVPRLGRDPASPMGQGLLQTSYSPVIVPEWSTSTTLAVVMSQNGWDWKNVCETADRVPYYWPSVLQLDLADGG